MLQVIWVNYFDLEQWFFIEISLKNIYNSVSQTYNMNIAVDIFSKGIEGGGKNKPFVFKVDQKILGFSGFNRNTFNRVFRYCLKYRPVTIIVI